MPAPQVPHSEHFSTELELLEELAEDGSTGGGGGGGTPILDEEFGRHPPAGQQLHIEPLS